MNSTVLLRKLIAIERQIGKTDPNTLRSLVLDAEDYLLQTQKQQADSFLAEAWREGVAGVEMLRETAN